MDVKYSTGSFHKYGVTFLLSLFIVGCGGGGGSDPDQFSISSSSVNFSTKARGDTPATERVGGSVRDVDQSVYIIVDASSTDLIANAYATISGTSGSLYIVPVSPDGMDVGSYSGTVRVSACFDSRCSRHLSGSPKNIAIRYDVEVDPLDVDSDGVLNVNDEFPEDPGESSDNDSDGIGDNSDEDDDNDGVNDDADSFPLDAIEWADNDEDGIGDNTDDNDDNDTFIDSEDPFPFDAALPGYIKYVSPSVIVSGRDNAIVISGRINEADQVYVNGELIEVTYISDSVAKLTVNIPEAGQAEIAIKYADVDYIGSILIDVVAPRYYSYAEMDVAGFSFKAYFDELNESLFIYNNSLSELLKYQFFEGTGWEESSLIMPGVESIAMSHGQEKLVAITEYDIFEINKDELTIERSDNILSNGSVYLDDLEFDYSGNAVIVTGYRGSGSSRIYEYNFETQSIGDIGRLYNSSIASSSTGEFILLGVSGISPRQPLVEYRPLSGELIETSKRIGYSSAEINNDGDRILLNNWLLYDENYSSLAEINYPGSVFASALSSSGDFVIAVDLEGALHWVDVSSVQNEVVTPTFSSAHNKNIGTVYEIVLTDDDLTVFVIGGNKTLVVPVWQIKEDMIGSAQTCPSVGCGVISVSDGVLKPSSNSVERPVFDDMQSPAEYVSPIYAEVGEHFEVLITGEGFSPEAVVMFDSVVSQQVRYVSETALYAGIPELTVGIYTVTVDGHRANAPEFEVVTQDRVLDAFWNLAGYYRELIYNPLNHSIYAADSDNRLLYKIDLSDNSYISQSVIGLYDVTFCPKDGYLYAATGDSVVRYDAETLEFVEEVLSTTTYSLECVAENKIIVAGQRRGFSILNLDDESSLTDSGEFVGIVAGHVNSSPTVDGVSARGDFAYFGETGTSSATGIYIRPYNMSGGPFPNSSSYGTGSWSADGSLGVINKSYIVNRKMSALRSLYSLFSSQGYVSAVAVSPDASKIYVVTGGDTLHTVDVNLLGDEPFSITNSIEISEELGATRRMVTSLDGLSVFIAGANGIIAITP